MKIHTATVLGRRTLSAHLVTITLAVPECSTTGIPDEYIRVLIAPQGEDLVLPQISDEWEVSQPEGTVAPISRVYTISDHRVVDGAVQLDLDIALHDDGPGSDWARDCSPGDVVGLIEPHGLYAAPADVAWQLLVTDITGLPATARILRGLQPGQRALVRVVLTDDGDRIPLPSPADVDLEWITVERYTDIPGALEAAVLETELPEADRYVWFAGEARASRAVRKHLRKGLGWPQSAFYTCGYWQLDKEVWDARYEAVAEEVERKAREAYEKLGADADEGTYLDTLEEIYEDAGL